MRRECGRILSRVPPQSYSLSKLARRPAGQPLSRRLCRFAQMTFSDFSFVLVCALTKKLVGPPRSRSITLCNICLSRFRIMNDQSLECRIQQRVKLRTYSISHAPVIVCTFSIRSTIMRHKFSSSMTDLKLAKILL